LRRRRDRPAAFRAWANSCYVLPASESASLYILTEKPKKLPGLWLASTFVGMKRKVSPEELSHLFPLLRRAVWQTVILLGHDLLPYQRLDTASLAYHRLLEDLSQKNFVVLSHGVNNSDTVIAWSERQQKWTLNYRRIVPAVVLAIAARLEYKCDGTS
jgi:hypothetical protein